MVGNVIYQEFIILLLVIIHHCYILKLTENVVLLSFKWLKISSVAISCKNNKKLWLVKKKGKLGHFRVLLGPHGGPYWLYKKLFHLNSLHLHKSHCDHSVISAVNILALQNFLYTCTSLYTDYTLSMLWSYIFSIYIVIIFLKKFCLL